MAAADTTTTFVGDYYLREERSLLQRIAFGLWDFTRRKPLGAFGALILLTVVLVGAFSPWLAGDPTRSDLSNLLAGPSTDHLFGTDHNGRDIYARIVFGCQITALVGLGTVFLVTLISLAVGVPSGYFAGRFDFAVQRLVDVWLSFPAIFLILTLVAVLGVSEGGGFFGLGRGPDVGPNPNDGEWFWYTFPRTTIVTLALGLVLAGGA
jgi:ABC-type dipeptide/oligopeptide/nickel transport system permease subunit